MCRPVVRHFTTQCCVRGCCRYFKLWTRMLRRSRNTNGRSTPTQKLVERARAHKVRLMDKGRIIASRQKDKLLENVNKGRIIAKEQKTKLLAKVKKSNIIANVQNNKLIEKALWGKRRLAESYRYHISRLKYFKDIGRRWRTLRKIMPLSGLSVGNRIEIYADGSQAFTEMWNAIRNAKKRVWLETYILKPDNVGLRTLEELTNAARRGCQVALIYDHLGSWTLSQRHLREFREANGIAVAFHNIWTNSVFSWKKHPLFRNHRKVLVIDDTTGFCGGMNVANDYAGVEVGGNGRYRDTHAKIEGPGVLHLASVFLHSFKLAVGEEFRQILQLKVGGLPLLSDVVPQPYHNGAIVQVIRNDDHSEHKIIFKTLTTAIRRAHERVYLTSPYFLPPQKLTRAIVSAAKRGVDVRILTSGKCETPFISQAAKHIYGVFLRNGVRVYELVPRELHAKTACIDGIFASVGSFNLDHLSSRHMLEANLNIMDPKMATVVEAQFMKDLESSQEVSLENWENRSLPQKFIHWLAYSICTIAFAWS